MTNRLIAPRLRHELAPFTRREFLHRAAGGFGALALAGMWSDLALAGQTPATLTDPLAPKPTHFPARAKRVIFIFSTGGASHVDTFDHKPKLYEADGKTVAVGSPDSAKRGAGAQFIKRPNWEFKAYGRSGTMVSDLFPCLGRCADDLCVVNSVHGDSGGHDKATMGMHTGSFNFARPSIGAWVSYGLGTENQNLPSFVVLAPKPPYTGAQAWGSDFLPGCHQGTHVVPGATPVPDVRRLSATDELQQMELDLLGQTNRKHQRRRAADLALEAQIRSFETAFGMQHAAPEAFDVSRESDATLELYGMKRGDATGFGWQCLIARRLAERGVRFIELLDVGSSGNWDSHGDMNDHAKLARNIDRPLAALVRDLKGRGLLDSTLLVWTTEFGRTPYNVAKDAKGREHHNAVFSSWLAGGGVRGGMTFGRSDELGAAVAENGVHVHDLHATILHLLGIDHERLTYRHAGRDFRLTDVAGHVVHPILA
jgi:hypothetical protein